MKSQAIRPTVRSFYVAQGKRCFDVVVSAIGLLVLALPICSLVLLILLLNGSPVFFRHKRIGHRGRPFIIWKFRTMRNRRVEGSSITVAGDCRVTSLGKWLRRFKLDELPQLFNVLKGDMSFVGPRPDVPGYMDKLNGDAARLLELRPGITGPASLAFKNEEALLARAADPTDYNDNVIFPEKVRLNLKYLETLSFQSDLQLIIRTVLS